MQRSFNLGVIRPQCGHIRCDPYPATCGFSLRIRRSKRIVNSTISRPKEILMRFTKRPFFGECRTHRMGRLLLAEKPKMEELQMDWLRSEDLKEEKNVTTPNSYCSSCEDYAPSPPS